MEKNPVMSDTSSNHTAIPNALASSSNPRSDDHEDMTTANNLPAHKLAQVPENKNTGERIDPTHPLWEELAPSDSYIDGVYWADLPRAQRTRWINAQSNQEAKRELKVIGQMFKKDPLSPVTAYFKRYVLNGFGLFTEGYTLFSIGNLTPLFQAVWPQCFKNHTVCSKNLLASQTYLQIIGIMVGQVAVGFEGDWIGRKVGLVQDALVMFLGLVMLTAMWGKTLSGWNAFYAVALFVYGVGVGGEYPMTSTTAMEYKAKGGSKAVNSRDDKLHRGRNVSLAFLMQGWGQLFNQAVLIIALLCFHHGSGNPPYSKVSAQWTFRVQFGIMAVMTLWLAYYRFYKLKYSSAALMRSKKNARVNQSGYDVKSLKLVFRHFGGRLIATAFAWFANDFGFYGNKLFQSTFIKVISPGNNSVIVGWNWNLLNCGVALVGYYVSALLIDHKLVGRLRLQAVGFLANFVLFLIPAILYNELRTPEHIHAFQAIYFLSGFFQQVGPNTVSFLVAAECFPIATRATAHGFSAAMGKLGALVPAVLYNYIEDRTKFWIVNWFCLSGFIVTIVFLPDTTGLDMQELERYWVYVRAGRASEYCGVAVHPRHLSLWEKVVLKRHHAYDADLDRMAKMAELRAEYKVAMEEAHVSELNGEKVDQEEDGQGLTADSHAYFANEHSSEKLRHRTASDSNSE